MYAIEVQKTSKVLLILSNLPLFVNLDLICVPMQIRAKRLIYHYIIKIIVYQFYVFV